jgi:hypothetical protein
MDFVGRVARVGLNGRLTLISRHPFAPAYTSSSGLFLFIGGYQISYNSFLHPVGYRLVSLFSVCPLSLAIPYLRLYSGFSTAAFPPAMKP